MSATGDRGAFLAGVGTLTAAEVAEWAKELGETADIPGDVEPDAPLMVAVVEFGGPGAMWRAADV